MSFSGTLEKVSTSLLPTTLLEFHYPSVVVVAVVNVTQPGSPGSSDYKNGVLFNNIQKWVFLGNNLFDFLCLVL